MSRIVVIGGGIAGLSAAAALSEDAEVTLLEGERAVGYHASGRSAAMYFDSYGNETVWALNRGSRAGLEAAGVLSPRGVLMVAPMGFEGFEDAAQGMAEIGVAEAQERVPILGPAVARAAWIEEAFDIDTDLLLQGFAKAVRAAGGRVVTGASVTSIVRDGAVWRVETAEETFVAERLVNAAGAWADGIAAMAGIAPKGIQPYRRSMARLPAPGGHDVTGWPFLLDAGETWYAKPDAGKWLVSPADEDPVEAQDAWADDMVLAEGLARYEAMVTAPVTRVEGSWAGLRSFAPDRTPVLGPDPAEPSFIWCAGQGGYGFQTSFAAARLVADLVFRRAPTLAEEAVNALSPGRF
ncbi:NAD(P)/FAD-dependent oxidoreductase [Aestuariibius sp. 2305UL40-4]|uniref:NAD(P)/FAD-dependent oxidoreductase n=1 Tax=Aestuariibius violaceus TaxID=3234132 RepID=UPI00345E49B5